MILNASLSHIVIQRTRIPAWGFTILTKSSSFCPHSELGKAQHEYKKAKQALENEAKEIKEVINNEANKEEKND